MTIQLGDRVKDKISGFKGIVVARTEWLNKCVRITIATETLIEGKSQEPESFDEAQVEVIKRGAFAPPKKEFTGGDRQNIKRSADPR